MITVKVFIAILSRFCISQSDKWISINVMTVVIIIRSDKIHYLSGQVKKVARVSKQDILYYLST